MRQVPSHLSLDRRTVIATLVWLFITTVREESLQRRIRSSATFWTNIQSTSSYCWVPSVGSLLLGPYCWVPSVGSLLLGPYCWVSTAGSLLLGPYCWVPTAGSLVLGP